MKRLFGIFTVFFVVFVIMWIGCPLGNSWAKVVMLKYSNFFPPANKISMLTEQWCREVEKRTNGAIKVNYFPGGTLTKPAQTYDGVTRGIADVGLSFAGYTRGRFPLTEVIDLPLGYKSGYSATLLANAYYEKFKPKEFDNVKLLYLHTSHPHMLFTKKPVKNLEDLKGLKIRSTGTSAKVVEALGANPVAMPMSEAYDALAKGVADGIVCPFEPMKGFKLADVVSYNTRFSSAYTNVAFVVMNKGIWSSLSPEIRKTIEQINKEWIEKQGRLWDDLDREAKEVFINRGGTLVELSEEENARWTNLLRPILDEYVRNMKAKGLPGDEALKFCVDYLKTHQK